jgi:arsenate reductase
MTDPKKQRVLILCTGNSARSQMAEALVNARLGDRWQAFSAGTQPAAQVNPFALRVLADIGIAHQGTPKHLSAFVDQPFDAVITVCDDASENCPLWPGQGRRIHIGFEDPAAVTGSDDERRAAFETTRDAIIDRLLPAVAALTAPPQPVGK